MLTCLLAFVLDQMSVTMNDPNYVAIITIIILFLNIRTYLHLFLNIVFFK